VEKVFTLKKLFISKLINFKLMINLYKKNAKLVLSNGIVFPGFYFGASGTAIGEIVFNTGMTGYQEVITDPSYYGQILTFTFPEIGNTGINFEDSESNINVKGIIVRNFSSNNSNWRSQKNFNQWLVERNIIPFFFVRRNYNSCFFSTMKTYTFSGDNSSQGVAEIIISRPRKHLKLPSNSKGISPIST